MNKEEIDKQIQLNIINIKKNKSRNKELETEVKKLKKELEKLSIKWSPQGGEYYIRCYGGVDKATSSASCRSFGFEHKSLEPAVKHAKAVKLFNWMYRLALDLNEGWEPDWYDYDESKYYVFYDSYRKEYRFDYTTAFVKENAFKSRETALKAIEILNNWGLDDD